MSLCIPVSLRGIKSVFCTDSSVVDVRVFSSSVQMKPFAAIHYCAVGKHASIGRASIAVNKQPTFSFVKLLVKFHLHSVRVVFFPYHCTHSGTSL